MDRLREEVEKAKQLQSQKEMLEQKLEVKPSYIKHIFVTSYLEQALWNTRLKSISMFHHIVVTEPLCQPTI